MRNFVNWYERHYRGITLLLAFLVVLFGVMAHMSMNERKASEAIHQKLDYESQLFKFLLIEKDCGCKRERK